MLFLSITTSRSIQVSSLFPPLPEDSAKSAKFSSIGTHFKGVMEAIRISMAGFPTSRPFHEFLNRFCIFAPEILDRSHDDITASREILEKVKLQGYQVGKTKVFIRAGQMAELDALRNEILGQSASKIQKRFRTYYFHKWFMGLRQASIQIQAHCRAELACHVFEHRRREVACVIMQKYVRRYIARKSYSVLCISATVIESGMRGMAARKEIYFRKKTKAAIKIQSEGRKYFARYKYMRMRKAAIVTQCACRVKMAKRELRKLRMAAKETGVLQEAKNKLEKEVEELTWCLQLEKRMRADLEETRKKENEKLQVAMQEMQKQFEETKTSLMKERDEALKKATEKPAIQEVAVSDDKVTAENEHLKVMYSVFVKLIGYYAAAMLNPKESN